MRTILSRSAPRRQCHVVLGQELSVSAMSSRLDRDSFYPHLPITAFPSASQRGGVGVFVGGSVKHLCAPSDNMFVAKQGRAVAVIIRLGRLPLCIVSHYGVSAPYDHLRAGSSVAALEDLESLLLSVRVRYPAVVFVVGGDFNFDPSDATDQQLPCFHVLPAFCCGFRAC